MTPITYDEILALSESPTRREGSYLVGASNNKKLIQAMQKCVDLLEKDGFSIHNFELICLTHSPFEDSYGDFGTKGYAVFRPREGGYQQQKKDRREDIFF